jgi:hypothetical protein
MFEIGAAVARVEITSMRPPKPSSEQRWFRA